jgi:serine/threonine protein kinase
MWAPAKPCCSANSRTHAFPSPYGYCLVQEYVTGETLLARMRRAGGRLPVAEVLTVGAQLAQILAELHQSSQPVLHLDVKPENVMYGSDGTLKLLDFGLAVLVGAGWPVLGGTLAYAPPEHLAGHPDSRSDVYALGITLWELLVGACPARGQYPTLPASYPLPLRQLLWQMVQPCGHQRPPAWEVALLLGYLAALGHGGVPRCA